MAQERSASLYAQEQLQALQRELVSQVRISSASQCLVVWSPWASASLSPSQPPRPPGESVGVSMLVPFSCLGPRGQEVASVGLCLQIAACRWGWREEKNLVWSGEGDLGTLWV